MSTRIARELEWGHRVTCVFLTDGAGKGASAATRDDESRAVLTSLGVPTTNQLFIGSSAHIPDGQLVLHLDRAWQALVQLADSRSISRIYSLAYEGGHQDHDAAHVLAVVLAQRRRLLHPAWLAPFYHGWRTPWQLFRVHRALPTTRRRIVRRLPAGEAVRHLALCWRYPSQRVTWMGLFPEYCLQRGLRRRETLVAVDIATLLKRPHPGPLLYERMQGFSYGQFRAAVVRFVATQGFDAQSFGQDVVTDD